MVLLYFYIETKNIVLGSKMSMNKFWGYYWTLSL